MAGAHQRCAKALARGEEPVGRFAVAHLVFRAHRQPPGRHRGCTTTLGVGDARGEIGTGESSKVCAGFTVLYITSLGTRAAADSRAASSFAASSALPLPANAAPRVK